MAAVGCRDDARGVLAKEPLESPDALSSTREWPEPFAEGEHDPAPVNWDLSKSVPLDGTPRPLMFAYWGTRGALPQLTWLLANVAAERSIPCTFSLSSSNELLGKFSPQDPRLLLLAGHRGNRLSVFSPKKLWALRQRLRERFAADGTRALVTLLSHVWTPVVAPSVRRAGVRHVVIVHDAERHPGDRRGLINTWLLRAAAQADRIVTLSKVVAERLIAARAVAERNVSVLFLPDLTYDRSRHSTPNPEGALRVLCFGRLLPYKGLELFVGAVEQLRREGVAIAPSVFGEGRIAPDTRARLAALGAEVKNRWIPHHELGELFARHDLLVASHLEASQSGSIATAFGAGVPVVATPTGGLVEQVAHGLTGLVAARPTSEALAIAIRRLSEDRSCLADLQRGVAATHESRSVGRFFERVSEIALGASP